jgi:hypothetical protein
MEMNLESLKEPISDELTFQRRTSGVLGIHQDHSVSRPPGQNKRNDEELEED